MYGKGCFWEWCPQQEVVLDVGTQWSLQERKGTSGRYGSLEWLSDSSMLDAARVQRC